MPAAGMIATPQGMRVAPLAGPQAYVTYRIVAPRATHYRPATCAEVDCPAYAHGWRTTICVTTELGAEQARYIRDRSGRAFYATEPDAAGMVTFTFPVGQRCFREHTVRLDREAHYWRLAGDWRQYDRPMRHANAIDWRDDFGEHQQKLADRWEQG